MKVDCFFFLACQTERRETSAIIFKGFNVQGLKPFCPSPRELYAFPESVILRPLRQFGAGKWNAEADRMIASIPHLPQALRLDQSRVPPGGVNPQANQPKLLGSPSCTGKVCSTVE